MHDQKVGIIAECVCDLPKSYLIDHHIDIVYFLIETDSGVFTDTDEITADNVLSYIQAGGKKAKSTAPPPDVYRAMYEKKLENCDEVIHIAISSGISLSCSNAQQAVASMGEAGRRVHVFDSQHLSTGLGHLVIEASEMAERQATAAEILQRLEQLRPLVSTSFITENVDFLYHNGKCSEKIKKICDAFGIHPILAMKNGKLAMKSFCLGSYDHAWVRYISKELKRPNIDKKRCFITCAGCNLKMTEQIRAQVEKRCAFEELTVTRASATVSSNCGPNTFGVLFVTTA